MGGEASRWLTYDEAAVVVGLSPEAVKRLAMRSGWPRCSDATGGMMVEVPEVLPPWAFEDQHGVGDDDATSVDQGGTRSLVGYLELRVEQLTQEVAEARTEMRGVRYEAESLRVEAGRAQVFAALVEAERARSAELKVERYRLAAELAIRRRPWFVRLLAPLLARTGARRRPF